MKPPAPPPPVPILRSPVPDDMKDLSLSWKKEMGLFFVNGLNDGGYVVSDSDAVLSVDECFPLMEAAVASGLKCIYDGPVRKADYSHTHRQFALETKEHLDVWRSLFHMPPSVQIPGDVLAHFMDFCISAMRAKRHPVMGLGCRWYLTFKPEWLEATLSDAAVVSGREFHVMPLSEVVAMLHEGIGKGGEFSMLDHGEKYPMPVSSTQGQMGWHKMQAKDHPEYIVDYVEKSRFAPAGTPLSQNLRPGDHFFYFGDILKPQEITP